MREISAAAQLRTRLLCWESELQDEKQSLRLLSACIKCALPKRNAREKLKGLLLSALLVEESDHS